MSGSSLLEYLQNELPEGILPPEYAKDSPTLETAIVEAYETIRDDVTDLRKNLEGLFDIYLESDDVDQDHLDSFLEKATVLESAPYRTDSNGRLRKFLHKTSSWYSELPEGEFDYIEKNWLSSKKGIKFITRVAHLTTCFLLGYSVSALGGEELSTLIPAFIAIQPLNMTPYFAHYFLFDKKTKLKPETHHFDTIEARDYIMEVYRLNRLAQEIERELEDIDSLYGQDKLDFIRTQGKRKIDRENIDMQHVPNEDLDNKVLQYGSVEIQEKMDEAKTQVSQIREYTEIILENVGISPSELEEDYITHGERVYEQEKLIAVELAQAQLEERLPISNRTTSNAASAKPTRHAPQRQRIPN